jgi:hypothetical protein
MVAVTKNRNVFNRPNFNCSYMARSSLAYVRIFACNLFFSRFLPIMQIRHILMKDDILIFSSETAEPN